MMVPSVVKKISRLKKYSWSIYRQLFTGENYQQEKHSIFSDVPAVMIRSGLTRSDVWDKVRKLRDCSNLVEIEAPADGKDHKLHDATFCGQGHICPICAARAVYLRKDRMKDRIKTAAKLYGNNTYFLTFTVRDGKDLSERLDHLKKSIRAFQRAGQKGRRGEWSKVRGGFLSIEIKRGGASWQWHAHAHAIIFCDSPLDYSIYDRKKKQDILSKNKTASKNDLSAAVKNTVMFDGALVPASKLSSEWLAATGGDSLSIDCQRITGTVKQTEKKVHECIKYTAYLSSNSFEDLPEIIDATHGRRFFSAYGLFRGYNDTLTPDPKIDGAEYYNIQWTPKTEAYTEGQPAPARARKYINRDGLAEQAEILTIYRHQRKEIIKKGGPLSIMAAALDALRDGMRAAVSDIWKNIENFDTERYRRRRTIIQQLELAL